MTSPFLRGMKQATRLTNAGKLGEATALIQILLEARRSAGTGPEPKLALHNLAVIEGNFTRLNDQPNPKPTKAPPKKPTPAPPASRPSLRPSLGATLRKIATGGMTYRAPASNISPPMAAGAKFISLTHRSGQGQRDYKLFIPANAANSPMPLIVMLHGCTQSPDDFASGTGMNAIAQQHGILVAYPAQPSGANASKCWNWFKPEDQSRGGGEPALIAGLVGDILHDHSADPARVYIAGLSAGGAAAAIVAAAYPDIFSAAGVHSGLPVGAATDIPQAFSAMRSGAIGNALSVAVPTIVFHGTADPTVHPSNGSAAIAQAVQAFGGLPASRQQGTSAGGRTYCQTSYAKDSGPSQCEYWEIDGAGHAWAGGQTAGSYTDPAGPDASQEMLRFFLQHAQK